MADDVAQRVINRIVGQKMFAVGPLYEEPVALAMTPAFLDVAAESRMMARFTMAARRADHRMISPLSIET